MTKIYDMEVKPAKVELNQDFFDKHIKDKTFNVYDVRTGWQNVNDESITHNDFVITALGDNCVQEAIRRALKLPYMSNEHGESTGMYAGFDADLIFDNINGDLTGHRYHNEFQQVVNKIADVHSYEYGNNQNITYFDNYWLLLSHTDLNNKKFIVDAYNLNGQDKMINSRADTTGLFTLSDMRQREINRNKHLLRKQEDDSRFDNIKKQIERLSKSRKEELKKLLNK